VRVAEEEIGVDDIALGEQRVAEQPQPRAAVEDQPALAAEHLDAGGIAAVADGLGSRARNAAAHPPEANAELALIRHAHPPRARPPAPGPDGRSLPRRRRARGREKNARRA